MHYLEWGAKFSYKNQCYVELISKEKYINKDAIQ